MGHDKDSQSPERFRVGIAVGDQESIIEGELPAGYTAIGEILPAIQQVTDAILGLAEAVTVEAGKEISCKKGCAACCRQLVPVSRGDAAHLRQVLDRLPEERQSVIKERFEAAKERLVDAGLYDRVVAATHHISPKDRMHLGVEYFKEQLACPFLENEECSIHADRPLSCREYLVTSPAKHCETLELTQINGICFDSKPSTTMIEMGSGKEEGESEWIPLVLLLEAEEIFEECSSKSSSRDIFERFVEKITEGSATVEWELV